MQTGHLFIILGVILVVTGLILTFGGRIPLLGHLPGDISVQGRGWSIHIPLATSLLLSVILTIILNMFFRR